jgi:AcrR family transcriptional regulator
MSAIDDTSTAERRPMRADAARNRAKIVEAAKAAFSERGLETQMEDIARRAEVGVGTLYRHFPTKDGLVRALIVDKMERMAEIAQEALEDQGDPWGAFAGVLWKGAEQAFRDRALAQVFSSQPQEAYRSAIEDETELAARMAQLLRRAQDAGLARRDADADDIPIVMCGLGAVVQNGRNWERYLQLMLDGFRNADADPLPR